MEMKTQMERNGGKKTKTKQQPKKREKLERQNSERVPPEKDTKHSRIVAPSIPCITEAELIGWELFYVDKLS